MMGQVFDQLAKIHPTVRGKEKSDIAAVKTIFYADRFHDKFMVCNFLFKHSQGGGFLFSVFLLLGPILLCNKAQHVFQRRNNLILLHLHGPLSHTGDFRPPGGFYHNIVAHLAGNAVGGKIIDFIGFIKLNPYYGFHSISSFHFNHSHSAAILAETLA